MSRHYPCTALDAGHTAARALQSVVPCDGAGCDCPCHTGAWPTPEPAPGDQLDLFGGQL